MYAFSVTVRLTIFTRSSHWHPGGDGGGDGGDGDGGGGSGGGGDGNGE